MYDLCMVVFLLSTLGGIIAAVLLFLSLIKKSMRTIRSQSIIAFGISFLLCIVSVIAAPQTDEGQMLSEKVQSEEMVYLGTDEGDESEEDINSLSGTELATGTKNDTNSKQDFDSDSLMSQSIGQSDEEQDTQLPETSDMEVHFIDVGQGDATLIKSDGHYMLIDTGENDKGTKLQNYLQKQGVDKLDYLILTHTDADHIGGADVIVNKFDIDNLFLGDYKKDNKTYGELMDAIAYKNIMYSIPALGTEYQLGNAVFTIVAPNGTYSDPNNSSIALILQNGNTSFLFTGDCQEEAEADILGNGINIDCDVYKLGHHGSRTASSPAFLQVITPIYGVVSCGQDNSYGHPHAEPLNNLRQMGVKLFRTDEQGSVVAYSDGKEITWNCAPSDTWKAGEPTGSSQVSSEKKENIQEIEEDTQEIEENTTEAETGEKVIANRNSKAFHRPDCNHLPMEKNRLYFNSREEAMAAGYDNPCDYCNP